MGTSEGAAALAVPGRWWAHAHARVIAYLETSGLDHAAARETADAVIGRLASEPIPDGRDAAVARALALVREELHAAERAEPVTAEPAGPSAKGVIRRQLLLPALRWRRGQWLPRPVLIPERTRGGRSRWRRDTTGPSTLDRTARRRRTAFIALVVTTTIYGVSSLAEILAVNGLSALDLIYLAVFTLLVAWLAQSFWTLSAGFVVLAGRALAAKPQPLEPTASGGGRVALVMPIYNEDTVRVFAGLEAMWRDLQASGSEAGRCDLFVLSDTTDGDVWLAEIAAWRGLRERVGDLGHIFYRRRLRNTGRKTGNIEDFLERWGSAYDYMLVLDADSLMSGAAMLELVRRMDANPAVGLIQAPPKLVRGRTLFARMLQTAGELYGPLAAAGTGFWARGEGNYWGHNAIIRVKPFMELCGLPLLPGRAPLGGPILSHDFVEAALLRRGGWQVWIADDVAGSYEEPPPSVEDFATRDRRWCQGNLQHIRILFARHLHWVSRLHLGIGIMAYLTSPLWLVFLILSAMQAWTLAHDRPLYFADGWPFPIMPVSVSQEATLLLVMTLGLLFVPKLFGLSLALLDGVRRRRLGGGIRLVGSALLETLGSALLAPLMMLQHSWFVVTILLGGAIEWRPQRREAAAGSLIGALRSFAWPTAIGVSAAATTWLLTPDLFWWLTPVLAGLVFAAPLAALGASERAGQALRSRGLLLIAEESEPPVVLRAVDPTMAELDGQSQPPRELLVRTVLEPQANALHLRLLRVHGGGVTAPQLLERKAVHLGPDVLDRVERRALLEDPALIERLHLQAWTYWPDFVPQLPGATASSPNSDRPSDPDGTVPRVA